LKNAFFITLFVASASFLRAWNHPVETLRNAYEGFDQLGIVVQNGLREINTVSVFKNGPHYTSSYFFDSSGRITHLRTYLNGKPTLFYSWTYGNDSIPVSAERFDYSIPGTEHSSWLFDTEGRTSSVNFFDSTGKRIKTVELFYDDCLVTSRTAFFLPGEEYAKTIEKMDCKGDFSKSYYNSSDSLVLELEEALRDQVVIWEYISFPPNRPAERNVISRERIFGGRTVERVYPPESRAMRKKLVEKNVISASGKLIKKKVIVRSFGKTFVILVRFKYNADGLPVQVVIAPAPGRKQVMGKMMMTISYVSAQ
jgi:hypothetical protein